MLDQLKIKDICVTVENKEAVSGLSLTLEQGQVHALMGPNGSGKSSLACALMGHPYYQISRGGAYLGAQDITTLAPEQRAAAGLFLAFQYPQSIPGLSVESFLRSAFNAVATSRGEQPMAAKPFHDLISAVCARLKLPLPFLERSVNDGFSGGEKKRLEMLQLVVLRPKFAVLDETDSGLDVDALRLVADCVVQEVAEQKLGVLVITHYQRLLHYLKPSHVHIMSAGKIIASGGVELVDKVESGGYSSFS